MPLSEAKNPLVISEKTLLPVSLIISLLTFVFFAAKVYSLAHSNLARIEEVEQKRLSIDLRLSDQVDSVSEKLSDVSQRTAKIEGKLDFLIEIYQKENESNRP